jgi:hypothetical protein
MAYHHDTIIRPMLAELSSREEIELIEHVPASLDFFTDQQAFKLHLPGAVAAITEVASVSDVIILTDFWNPLVPVIASLCYANGIPMPKLCSIFHGGVNLVDDLCHGISFAREYEAYLNTVYHRVAVPECCQYLCGAPGKVASPFPWVGPAKTSPVSSSNRVYFPHRFEADKGCDDFVALAEVLECTNLSFVVFGDKPELTCFPPNIVFVGRKPRTELFQIYRQGGWVWSSVRSEIYAYAVREAMACGLTPCVNWHAAYDFVPDRFKYSCISEAAEMLSAGNMMTEAEQDEAMQGWETHTSQLISNLLEGL